VQLEGHGAARLYKRLLERQRQVGVQRGGHGGVKRARQAQQAAHRGEAHPRAICEPGMASWENCFMFVSQEHCMQHSRLARIRQSCSALTGQLRPAKGSPVHFR
jgi:hypothetical protein